MSQISVKSFLFSNKHKISSQLWRLTRLFLLVGLEFMILYPFLFMIVTSLRAEQDIMNPTVVWLTRHWSLESFRVIIQRFDYLELLIYTLQICIGSSILQTLQCSLVGYGFARFSFRFKKFFFAFVILTIIVPMQTYITPLFAMFKNFQIPLLSPLLELTGMPSTFTLLDTPFLFWIQALFGMGFRSGLFISIYRQFFRGLPIELEDAARIDGCSAPVTFFKVMLPNAKTSMLTVFIFSFIWHWNDYFASSVLSTSRQTISVALSQMKYSLETIMLTEKVGNYAILQSQVQAGALLAVLPLIILFVFTQRYFTEGIERSGIVG